MKTMNSKLLLPLTAISFAGILLSSSLQAAVMYDTAGAIYSQNFNSLQYAGTYQTQYDWTNGTTLEGWYWANPDGGSSSKYSLINRHAGGTTGAEVQINIPLSIGFENLANRSLGMQSGSSFSGSTQFFHYGVQLINGTGSTLNEFTLGFTAEQWRVLANQGQDQITFDYQVFSSGGSISAATGWTEVAELTFYAPVFNAGESGWLDGKANANREVFSTTITGVNWGAGEELWLRWNDKGGNGTGVTGALQSMMALDNVTFSAVPEPSTFALIGLCSAALLFHRRRRI